jgi:hypothetical protein
MKQREMERRRFADVAWYPVPTRGRLLAQPLLINSGPGGLCLWLSDIATMDRLLIAWVRWHGGERVSPLRALWVRTVATHSPTMAGWWASPLAQRSMTPRARRPLLITRRRLSRRSSCWTAPTPSVHCLWDAEGRKEVSPPTTPCPGSRRRRTVSSPSWADASQRSS